MDFRFGLFFVGLMAMLVGLLFTVESKLAGIIILSMGAVLVLTIIIWQLAVTLKAKKRGE